MKCFENPISPKLDYYLIMLLAVDRTLFDYYILTELRLGITMRLTFSLGEFFSFLAKIFAQTCFSEMLVQENVFLS